MFKFIAIPIILFIFMPYSLAMTEEEYKKITFLMGNDGSTSEIKELILKVDDFNTAPPYRISLFSAAIHYKRKELVHFLLANGLDLSGKKGADALTMLCGQVDYDINLIKEVIAAGVPVDSVSDLNVTCLSLSAHRSSPDLFLHLIDLGANPDAKLPASSRLGEISMREFITTKISALSAMNNRITN